MTYDLASVDAADWPQWLGPQRDGISPETGLLHKWDDKGPPLVWDHKVGEGYSGPVVAGEPPGAVPPRGGQGSR